jgi:hypothetical protein
MTIDELRGIVRRRGLPQCLLIALMSGLRKYLGIRVCRVFVRDCVKDPPAPRLPDGISLRVARSEELLVAAQDPELDLDGEFVRPALARGDLAFGALDGARLVSYEWRAFCSAPYMNGLWAKAAPPYHYGYKAFARASHRGRRIHVAVALFAGDQLAKRGHAAMVFYFAADNAGSLNVQEFLGSRAVGYAGHLMWCGRCIPFRTPAVKKIGFAFGRPR